jgi:hypothetical protein
VVPFTFIGEKVGQDLFVPIIAGPKADLEFIRLIGLYHWHFTEANQKVEMYFTLNGDGLLIVYTEIFNANGKLISSNSQTVKVFVHLFLNCSTQDTITRRSSSKLTLVLDHKAKTQHIFLGVLI